MPKNSRQKFDDLALRVIGAPKRDRRVNSQTSHDFSSKNKLCLRTECKS